MRLYVDDDSVDPGLIRLLRRDGHDVQIPADAGLVTPANLWERTGEQPEASLAWGGVSRTAKRRQPVPMPYPK